MKYSQLVRLNQGLLGGTALLALMSIATGGLAAGGLAGAALGGIANFTAGMTGNNLGTLVERLRSSSDVLRNEDLAKAAGRTIGKTLSEKIAPKFPELEAQLNALADQTEGYWVEWTEQAQTLNVFASLQEDQLVNLFATEPHEFTQYKVLPLPEWQEVVTWLFEKGCEKRVLRGQDAGEYQDVITALAKELEPNFSKYLRQVLKDDERAFKGMLLDLLGLILSRLDDLATREDTQQISQDTRRLLHEVVKLRQDLNRPPLSPPPRPIMGAVDTVPKLPDNFLPRPQDLEQLKDRLLTPTTQTLVMTGQARKVGLQGMGGIGKTVLAAALARDEVVRRQFRDGIVWLTVGIQPEPMALYQRIATTLGESNTYQEGEAQWNAYLSNLLGDKSCLLVLDDVWEKREAERFVEVLGSDCRLLLTTRDARLIQGLGAQGYEVEMLDDNQARQLLANWAQLHVDMLPPEADAVIKHCGRLPLALALAGAQVHAGTSWSDLVAALDAADLRFLDYTHGSIYKSLEVSIQALDPPLQQAYLELGIVAPDVAISEAALVMLWGRRENQPEYQLRRWLTELVQRALVFVSGESPHRWVV
ncbi:MAG: NB-ARC domain-containing protein, partial [Spirulinaceae cyanobacterium]